MDVSDQPTDFLMTSILASAKFSVDAGKRKKKNFNTL